MFDDSEGIVLLFASVMNSCFFSFFKGNSFWGAFLFLAVTGVVFMSAVRGRILEWFSLLSIFARGRAIWSEVNI